ncbi:MAG: DNA-directed RNA polymerase subunit omega [Actinomycetota bacterium]|nr:DNA-directed RNA polymerase subunit omega [Actinomycetota bacterium]
MASRHDSMMNPAIEGLLERAGSKFTLVTLGSKRARQINSYYNQLSEGLGTVVPPQVSSSARKPLSIAFEEISADKILGVWPDPEVEAEAGTDEDTEPAS